MIEIKDIEKLASLARIDIKDSEKESLRTEINSILTYVGQIQSASGTVEREIPEHRNVFRNDGEPHESGIHTEAILAEAPKRKGNYLEVKKIM